MNRLRRRMMKKQGGGRIYYLDLPMLYNGDDWDRVSGSGWWNIASGCIKEWDANENAYSFYVGNSAVRGIMLQGLSFPQSWNHMDNWDFTTEFDIKVVQRARAFSGMGFNTTTSTAYVNIVAYWYGSDYVAQQQGYAPTNQWCHCKMVRLGGNVSHYTDGVHIIDIVQSTIGNVITNQFAVAGCRWTQDTNSKAYIRNLVIYKDL